jgi:hypothetical protein
VSVVNNTPALLLLFFFLAVKSTFLSVLFLNNFPAVSSNSNYLPCIHMFSLQISSIKIFKMSIPLSISCWATAVNFFLFTCFILSKYLSISLPHCW